MARLEKIHEPERSFLEKMDCPTFETTPWVEGTPLSGRRVVIVSTGGLHKKDDRPFTVMPGDNYRIIPGDIEARDLVMSHISTNFDHTGFQQDINVIFPIDRLRELKDRGVIGSVADYHYSFMGATPPILLESAARELAKVIKGDNVDALFLTPV